jgi:YfiH family protein
MGDVSVQPYASFNLATHVGDKPSDVAQNRALLRRLLRLPSDPLWLEQVHGTHVVNAVEVHESEKIPIADASVSLEAGRVCVVMTADCLPVLLCDEEGTQVAAVHAGWRGLVRGVIERSVAQFLEPSRVLAWLGPAISQKHFEVGAEVKSAFEQAYPESTGAFIASARDHYWYVDLYQLARICLQSLGVSQVFGGDCCTFSDDRFFFLSSRGRYRPNGFFDLAQ